jgi:Protein of unknown function (DUF4446)
VPELTNDQLALALAVVAGVALISFLTTLFLALRLRRVRRDFRVIKGNGKETDIVAAVAGTLGRQEALEQRIDHVVAGLDEQSAKERSALQRFAIVRYDAFDEMGGMLSFSAAFLDDHGDGVVLTSINGRTETRTYAKTVKGMTSEFHLSDEEREAIAAAAAGYDRSAPITASP